ncbi:MAG: S8 family serine peptidase [Kordiimonadaceae bacterium]|nr:S8 family serine peptidase [Kordiimonadaceae bacterium]
MSVPLAVFSEPSAAQSRSQSRPPPRPAARPTVRPTTRQQSSGRVQGTENSRLTREEVRQINSPRARQAAARENLSDRQLYRVSTEEARAARKLASRVVDAQERKSSKTAKLNAKLQEQYGLAYVDVDSRFTLVRYGELIGINLSDESREIAEGLGFTVLRRAGLTSIGVLIDLLRMPEGEEFIEAFDALKKADPTSLYRYNATYAPTGVLGGAFEIEDDTPDAAPSAPAALSAMATGGTGIHVGMIDTGIKQDHKLFTKVNIEQKNWGRGMDITPRDHGTAVASILALGGHQKIFAADVFSGVASYADAEAIVIALDWMAGQNVGVINISLAGPPNDLLQFAVSRLIKKGHILVAAVGNQGSDGPPLYPASYPGVIGVTAVDKSLRIYDQAFQGDAVDFAALGVKIKAASYTGKKKYSGTSFAAPIVASRLALHHRDASLKSAFGALAGLIVDAKDLGAAGYDPVFGFGHLGKAQTRP